MQTIALYIALLIFTGCETIGQSPTALNPNSIYVKNMPMTVNGKIGTGVISVPVANSYRIDITLESKPEIIRFYNCHRELILEKTALTGLKQSFYLAPLAGIETDGFCPIYIDALDLSGINASGIIEVQNELLKSAVFCGGAVSNNVGVSICQARVGLSQRILFTEEVIFEKLDGACSDLIPLSHMSGFDVTVSKGLCVYTFYSKKSDSFHRLVTFGYTDVLLKSVGVKNQ